MADEGTASTSTAPAPKVVEYDPVTGVPAEFNEYLPKDSEEYKKWKALQEGPEAVEKLTLKDKEGNEIEKQLPGGKVKKKQKPQIVLEIASKGGKRKVTNITGLELFGVKLSEASKTFKQKFACGCSVTKTATGTEQIEMQGDFLHQVPDILIKNYSKYITKADVFFIGEDKKKANYYDDGSDDDE